MKKLRILCALLLLLAFTLTMTCCAVPEGEETEEAPVPKNTITLYVYNWGEYMADGSEDSADVNEMFEEYFNENLAVKYGTKVKVNYSTYSSNEDMYAKIKSGAVTYDVIVPSDYMIERMIDEDMLAKLNFDNIPNFEENIGEEFKNPEYDPENEYSVPYAYGMIGVIYNSSVVDEDDENIGSWKLMFDEDSPYKHDILQLNNPRDAFGTALYYLGYDVNEATEEQWRDALELMKKQKSILQGYVMDEIFNKMKDGSASIAAYYAGDFLSMYEDNEDLEFFYPEEGTNYYVDAFCIPKNSRNKEIAEEYINFMLSEEPAVENAEYNYYASPNVLVQESEDYRECLEEIREDAYDILYKEPTENYLKSTFRDLGDEGLMRMNNYWEELKVESSISPVIYVLCGIIVAAMIGLAVFFAVRKKKRMI